MLNQLWVCRDIDITVERLRFAAGELTAPNCAQHCLQRTLIDRCWVMKPDSSSPEIGSCDKDSFTWPDAMVYLHVHEDVENELLTVRMPLRFVAVCYGAALTL